MHRAAKLLADAQNCASDHVMVYNMNIDVNPHR